MSSTLGLLILRLLGCHTEELTKSRQIQVAVVVGMKTGVSVWKGPGPGGLCAGGSMLREEEHLFCPSWVRQRGRKDLGRGRIMTVHRDVRSGMALTVKGREQTFARCTQRLQ